VRNDLISILYYRMRYGRLSPLTALIPGAWLTAVPRLHVEMEEAVNSWEAAPESQDEGADAPRRLSESLPHSEG
jgi:hypothetical protein